MKDQSGRLTSINWQELLPWTGVLPRLLKIALSLRMLTLAALGLMIAWIGSHLILMIFSVDRQVNDMLIDDEFAHEFQPVTAGGFPQHSAYLDPLASPLFSRWLAFSMPLMRLLGPAHSPMSLACFTALLLIALWTVGVWAVFGGAITRMAALELTRGDKLDMKSAIKHSLKYWTSYVYAPLSPLAAVAAISLPVALLGVLMRWMPTIWVTALLWPAALLAGVVMTVLVVGLLFGWPLMWAAISVERGDAFDGISRAYSFVTQRPLHYLFYALVAGFFGLLGSLFVFFFAQQVVNLTEWAASWGSSAVVFNNLFRAVGDQPSLPSVRLIKFFNNLVDMAAWGFVISFFWTSATGIYLLLRRQVDGTELDDISIDAGDIPRGLPPLATDAAGVPKVADPSSARTQIDVTQAGGGSTPPKPD